MISAFDLPALWTDETVMTATGCPASALFLATRVVLDSRQLAAGDLFIACQGDHCDGHDYIADVAKKGAVAALVLRRPDSSPTGFPLVKVPDIVAALNDLAGFARMRAQARVVGVTGSCGKTSVKEITAHLLAGFGQTYANPGNFNNRLGVPLSLANLPPEAAFAVFEMGMSAPDEIESLARQVQPDVAIITNIAAAHLASFADVADIAMAKAEVFHGMSTLGTAILPQDSPYLAILMAQARTQGLDRIWTFGRHDEADARLISYRSDGIGGHAIIRLFGEIMKITLAMSGEHAAINALASLLAIKALDLDPIQAAQRLAMLKSLPGRGLQRVLPWRDGSITLIDESYNASPVAMRAAFQILASTAPDGRGRRVAVLGDMLEMGDKADALHEDLRDDLLDSGAELIFSCGEHMKRLNAILPPDRCAGHFDDSVSLAQAVLKAVRPGDVVMIKGSNGMKMSRVITALIRPESLCAQINQAGYCQEI